jgi:hypothetical protein
MATLNLKSFTDGFFKLNPEGNPQSAFNYIAELLDPINENKQLNGDPLTYSFLAAKYKEYIDWWNKKFGKQEEKFIPKKDKKRTIYDFLDERKYNESFEITIMFNDDRDPYLFGKDTIDDLLIKVGKFNQIIDKNIWKTQQENEESQ